MSTHAPLTRTGRRSPEFKFVRQGRNVGRAWALELDAECLYRWGDTLYDELSPGTRATQSPDEIREFIIDWRLIIAERMAYLAYCKFPDLPRLERNVLALSCRTGLQWLFVLKDNSSRDALDAPVTPELVENVKEFLGVSKDAQWFDVSRRIIGRCD